MKQKILIFLLATVFVFSNITVVDAKGSRSRSSGFGGSSFSRSSGGYSGSSHSKSSGGFFSKKSSSTTKSSSGYTGSSSKSSSSKSSSSKSSSSSGSSSRSVPGSYSGSSSASSKNSSSSSKTKSTSAKSSYMKDSYKKQSSKSNFKTYKQNLNAEQKRVYDKTMNSNYRVKNRMNFEDAMRTRPQRISKYNSRPIFININTGYFGGPLTYGSAFVGPWDLWFLMRASDLFWYHHWHEINPYRDYFEAAEFAKLEARVKELEKEHNGVRDTSYLEPDMDPDLQFSDAYQQKHLDNIYYTNKYSRPSTSPILIIILILGVVIVLVIVVKKVSRPKRNKNFHSRIY